jgi:predicted phosphodiesterase
MTKVRLLIVSDIHVVNDATGGTERSFSSTKTDSQPGHNALNDLVATVVANDIRADYVISCGDISDRCDAAALAHAWNKLKDLKKAARAKRIIATPGNHDTDSRGQVTSYNAFQGLKALRPYIPFGPKKKSDEFWSNHCAVFEDDQVLFASVNTCAFHHTNATKEERERGRLTREMIAYLNQSSKPPRDQSLKVLLLHHHPVSYYIPSPDIQADNEVAIGGEELLHTLSEEVGPGWMLIHGHRHFPKLMYSQGGSTSPVILSCGSLSSVLYNEISRVASNQFYVIEVDLDLIQQRKCLLGKYEAWSYAFIEGWKRRGCESLPSIGGFGHRANIPDEAQRVANLIGRKKSIPWAVVSGKIPHLEYMIPDDIRNLGRHLAHHHGLKLKYTGELPSLIEKINEQ